MLQCLCLLRSFLLLVRSRLNTTNLNQMIAYDQGELDEEQILELFQDLVDSGLAWTFQGDYERAAIKLINDGLISGERSNLRRSIR